MRLIASPRDDFEVSPKRKNCIVNGILTPFDNNQESISSIKACTIKVITKLPNSEQSYKGKVKTHNYINRQNQSTTGKL